MSVGYHGRDHPSQQLVAASSDESDDSAAEARKTKAFVQSLSTKQVTALNCYEEC